MSDLIKREDAIKSIKQWRDNDGSLFDVGLNQAIREIKAIPSADRPQGEWRKRFGSINCSVCKHSNWSYSFEDLLRSFNYCPNCGAKMKGADDERGR